MKFFLSALILICSLYPFHASAKPLTPADVSARVSDDGIVYWMGDLSDAQRKEVMHHISNGEKPWLDLVLKIPGDDSGVDDIPVSLARALPRNAVAVLAILDDGYATGHDLRIENICAAPFARPTSAYLKKYKKEAIAAVIKARAGNPDKTDRCLKKLETIDPDIKIPTPAEISAGIDAKGGDEFWSDLSPAQEEKIIDHISNGEKPWLDLIQKLPAASDEMGLDDMAIPLAKALIHNAAAVLTMLDNDSTGPQFPIKDLCAAPFFRPTKAYLITYKKQAISAVTAARASTPDKADRCLKQLEAIDPDKPWDPR